MIKKVLLLLVPLLAFVGGAAGGAMLRGDAPVEEGAEAGELGAETEDHGAASAEKAAPDQKASASHGESDGSAAWFRFPNQFFVPVVRNGHTEFVIILTVTLETTSKAKTEIEALEHRLRDSLLRRLIIHANTGGFDGNFTAEAQLRRLRSELLVAAQSIADDKVQAVLIEDIARQDS